MSSSTPARRSWFPKAPSTNGNGLAKAEDSAIEELAHHKLRTAVDVIKTRREMRANKEIVTAALRNEAAFYEAGLETAGSSQVRQHVLAERMALLVEMNDDVIERYRR